MSAGLGEVRAGDVLSGAGGVSNILLICGPSGAGKSTFINAMMEGRLSAELTSLLPCAAEHWATVEANDILKDRLSAEKLASDARTADGMILHCDTFFIKRAGIDDYFDDPVAQILLQAQNLVIVHIKPAPDQLKAQYDARLQLQLQQKGRAKALWARLVRKPMKKWKHRLSGTGRPYTEDLYERPESINGCYKDWEDFLRQLIRRRPSARIFQITPDGDKRGENFFLLPMKGLSARGDPRGRDAHQTAIRAAKNT